MLSENHNSIITKWPMICLNWILIHSPLGRVNQLIFKQCSAHQSPRLNVKWIEPQEQYSKSQIHRSRKTIKSIHCNYRLMDDSSPLHKSLINMQVTNSWICTNSLYSKYKWILCLANMETGSTEPVPGDILKAQKEWIENNARCVSSCSCYKVNEHRQYIVKDIMLCVH